MAAHNDIGRWGEEVAARYLMDHGWYIRHRDWHYGHRDIDIVAIDGDMSMLLMVEVKTRTSAEIVEPDKAIDLEKRRNIIEAAEQYVRVSRLENLEVRYDTISVVGTPDKGYTVEHKENAFNVVDSYMYYEEKRKKAIYKYKKRPGCWK